MADTALLVGSGAEVPSSGFKRLPGPCNTPYGETADGVYQGKLSGEPVTLLFRHGQPRQLAPHVINYRANLWWLKQNGARRIVSIYTVGGIAPELADGALVLPDQVIDYTWGRAQTFDDTGATHVDFASPFDADISVGLASAASALSLPLTAGGTLGCTQGPRLESAAEVDRLERDGCSLVGMTAMPEAALARELELPIAGLCIVVNPAAGRGSQPDRMDLSGLMQHARLGSEQALAIVAAWLAGQGQASNA